MTRIHLVEIRRQPTSVPWHLIVEASAHGTEYRFIEPMNSNSLPDFGAALALMLHRLQSIDPPKARHG